MARKQPAPPQRCLDTTVFRSFREPALRTLQMMMVHGGRLTARISCQMDHAPSIFGDNESLTRRMQNPANATHSTLETSILLSAVIPCALW